MSYTPPTLEQFRARFPIFVDKPDPQIEAILAEASSQVDNTWREADYPAAVMYLTAHLLATDASQEGEEIAIGPSGAGQVIASESIAGMSVSYFNGLRGSGAAATSNSDYYTTTEYGRRFLRLVKSNFAGPVAI